MTKAKTPVHMRTLSLGAGVQSSTLYLMGVLGKIDFDLAIFADTGDEPAAVYDHLAYLESMDGPEIVRVSAGNLGNDVLSHRRHLVNLAPVRYRPAFFDIPVFFDDGVMTKRQCTTNYKIKPIYREIRRRIGRGRYATATTMLGISTDEFHRVKPSRREWVTNEHPLIDLDMSRSDCLEYWSSHISDRVPPKSACVYCPFHAPKQWLALYRAGGPDWKRVVEIDDFVGQHGQRLHRSGQPIAEVAERMESDLRMSPQLPGFDLDGFGNECEGHCGV